MEQGDPEGGVVPELDDEMDGGFARGEQPGTAPQALPAPWRAAFPSEVGRPAHQDP